MKFSALNVDFNGPSLDFFRFKETCARRYQREVPLKVVILAVVYKSTVKTVQIGIGMLPITTNFSDERFSRINIDDFEKPELQKNKWFYCFFLQFSAATRTSRVNCEEMAEDRLRQFANRNCAIGFRASREN